MKVVEAGVGGASSPFRAGKRNKHARVWAARQAPSMKKWREFQVKKQLRTKYAFSNIATFCRH